mmetsp:Transcript_97789/g.276780  ORF Transcript_97789/g.276780 Transcript_97789/m.276780 type:complete len:489 (-) Transcript_97789:88-1554(-)
MVEQATSPEEIAADCPYINEYCRDRHRSVVRCTYTKEKGRVLMSDKAFRQGDVIFREPPLHIVAEQKGNDAFERLKVLCAQNSRAFEFEPLWYWTALGSLRKSQLGPNESRLRPISEDQQRKLLLLYHPDVTEASEAVKSLVKVLGLDPYLEPLDLERLVQIWILNCFEHSDEPLGYSTYFMSSFMSHSCLPNAVWHYEGDDFVLRARCAIEAGDEISVSYLSEDALLESVPARRKHLKDSKHFICACVRCNAVRDMSRGFRCTHCFNSIFFNLQTEAGLSSEPGAPSCDKCRLQLTQAEVAALVEEEKLLETSLEGFERKMDRNRRGKHTALIQPLEEAIVRAERALSQHWLLDKAWSLMVDAYDRNERPKDAEILMRKRIVFQEGSYPGLSGTRAWTLEAFADMLLRHSGATVEPSIKVPNHEAARHIAPLVPQVLAESQRVLSLMFGEQHEYFTTVNRKSMELRMELERLLGPEASEASGCPASS